VILLEVAVVDSRKEFGLLGVWWTFRSLNVAEARADVRMDGVGVELLVPDVVWRAIPLPIPLALAR